MRAVLGAIVGMLAVVASAWADESAEPWKLGVFPIVTPVTLFKRFALLRDYLAERLAHSINLETARDFPTFVRRTSQRRYHLLITAPHFAVRAVEEGHYRIVASLKDPLYGLYVVRRDSPIEQLEQLAGRSLATPPPQALITAAGRLDLEEVVGLRGERAPRYLTFRSHNAAYEAVLGGQAEAAVVSANAVKVALARGAPLRVIGQTRPLPNMAFLVARSLGEETARRVVAVLVAMDDTDEGRQVLRRLGFPGYRPAGIEDYEVLRPYLRLLRAP